MKIDESCIEHNVVRMITELTECTYEYDDDPKWAYMTLANIRGVVEMAEVLKDVLKA